MAGRGGQGGLDLSDTAKDALRVLLLDDKLRTQVGRTTHYVVGYNRINAAPGKPRCWSRAHRAVLSKDDCQGKRKRRNTERAVVSFTATTWNTTVNAVLHTVAESATACPPSPSSGAERRVHASQPRLCLPGMGPTSRHHGVDPSCTSELRGRHVPSR